MEQSEQKTVTQESKVSKSDSNFKFPRKLKKSATWQRITVSLLGILVEIGIWQWATWHLYVLPVTSISSFTTITVNVFYVIGSIVVFFVTGKLIYDLKVDTVAQVITEGKNVIEKHDNTSTQNINEHIIEEGDQDSPENRPFSQYANQDSE